VIALLGDGAHASSWLEVLADHEILIRSREARCPSEREYAFRHALRREGAYAMLTEGDRRSAHGSAGDWRERSGEKDPWILADHFERGSESKKAITWMVRAARRAMDRGDLAGAAELSRRGERLGAQGEERGPPGSASWTSLAWSGQAAADLLEKPSAFPEGTTCGAPWGRSSGRWRAPGSPRERLPT
jgi:hypothetical protein